jgi:hypothetical protein
MCVRRDTQLPVMDDLAWGHNVNICGSIVSGSLQLKACPVCDEVINTFGRVTQCGHVYCAACAGKIQSGESACSLCTDFGLSNPPGANNAKATVEMVTLATGVYICDFVMPGQPAKACGRGFDSENGMLQCTHGARSSRTTTDARRERFTPAGRTSSSGSYDDRVSMRDSALRSSIEGRISYADRQPPVQYSRSTPLAVRSSPATEGYRDRVRYGALGAVARDSVIPAGANYRLDEVEADPRYVEPRNPYYGGVAFRDMIAAGGGGGGGRYGHTAGRSVVYAATDSPTRSSFRGEREQWGEIPVHHPGAREAMPWDAQEPTAQPRSRGTRLYY